MHKTAQGGRLRNLQDGLGPEQLQALQEWSGVDRGAQRSRRRPEASTARPAGNPPRGDPAPPQQDRRGPPLCRGPPAERRLERASDALSADRRAGPRPGAAVGRGGRARAAAGKRPGPPRAFRRRREAHRRSDGEGHVRFDHRRGAARLVSGGGDGAHAAESALQGQEGVRGGSRGAREVRRRGTHGLPDLVEEARDQHLRRAELPDRRPEDLPGAAQGARRPGGRPAGSATQPSLRRLSRR